MTGRVLVGAAATPGRPTGRTGHLKTSGRAVIAFDNQITAHGYTHTHGEVGAGGGCTDPTRRVRISGTECDGPRYLLHEVDAHRQPVRPATIGSNISCFTNRPQASGSHGSYEDADLNGWRVPIMVVPINFVWTTSRPLADVRLWASTSVVNVLRKAGYRVRSDTTEELVMSHRAPWSWPILPFRLIAFWPTSQRSYQVVFKFYITADGKTQMPVTGELPNQVSSVLRELPGFDHGHGAVDRLYHGGQVVVVDAVGVHPAAQFVEQRYLARPPACRVRPRLLTRPWWRRCQRW